MKIIYFAWIKDITNFHEEQLDSNKIKNLWHHRTVPQKVIDKLPGEAALGHVRYSTTGKTLFKNIQPLFADLLGGGLAISHNGNLTNGIELRNKLIKSGSIFQSTSDTEAFIHLISKSKEKSIVKKIIDALFELKGAYSFGLLTNKITILCCSNIW